VGLAVTGSDVGCLRKELHAHVNTSW